MTAVSGIAEQLKALQELLGADTVERMCAIFLSDLATQRPLLQAKAIRAEPERARRAAHDLVTNAGSLGFQSLSDQARKLEHAILACDGDAILTLSRDIETLAAEAEAQLAAYGQGSVKDHDKDRPHR